MYATFSFYVEVYGGIQITEQEWPVFSRQADSFVNNITFGRLVHSKPVPQEAQMACCAVAEALKRQEGSLQGRTLGVSSESVGGQSVSYSDAGTLKAQLEREQLDAAGMYLPSWHPLRYAGVGRC